MTTLIKKIVLFAGAALLLTTPALGEYYRYVDANGMTRYTDDLSTVPPDQRPKVKTYESVKSDPVRRTPEVSSNAHVQKKASEPNGDTWFEKASSEADKLNQKRKDLDAAYQSLQTERAALVKEKPTTKAGKKTIRDYRDRVRRLNTKIADYEERHAAYQEEVAAYNRKYKKQ